MKIRPLRNYVVIQPEVEKEFTDSGIYLPGNINEKKPSIGEVLAVGPGVWNNKGELLTLGVNVGDKVMFHPNDLGKYIIDNKEVYLLVSPSIIGILS